MKKQHWIIMTACLALIITCVTIFLNMPKEKISQGLPVNPDTMKVQPVEKYETGIGTWAKFLITCNEDVSPKLFQDFLSIGEGNEFKLEKKRSGEFILSAKEEFAENQLVNLVLKDEDGTMVKSWAFQTRSVFKVISTIPYDKTSYVPLNSVIEFTFSTAAADEKEFEKNFTIEPKVEGKIEKYGSNIAFIPNAPFEKGKTYRAVLSGQMQGPNEEKLGKDTVILFKTAYSQDGEEWQEERIYNVESNVQTFMPDQTPAIGFYSPGLDLSQTEIHTQIYKYPSFETYTQALAAYSNDQDTIFDIYRNYDFPEEGLAEHLSFASMPVYNNTDYKGGIQYISFPEPLEQGWYLSVSTLTSPVSGRELILKKVIQVSPVSLYYGQIGNDMVSWVNDTESGNPFENAEITVRNTEFEFSGKTNKDGVATLSTKTKEELKNPRGIITIKAGDYVFADLFGKTIENELQGSEKYYTYIYTDRKLYQPSDTVKVWGFLKPRNSSIKMPQELYLSLGGLYKTPVELSADGSFTTEISFSKLGSRYGDWPSLSLMEKGSESSIAAVNINISEYTKPIYILETMPEKVVYTDPQQAPININMSMKFFDGTPAAGVALNVKYDSQDNGYNIKVKTDANGKAKIALKSKSDEQSWYPDQMWVSIESDQTENQYFSSYQQINILHRDIMLNASAEENNGSVSAVFEMNKIDISKIEKDNDLWEYDNLKGSPYDSDITAELIKVTYIEKPVKSYYDPIQKRNITIYDYERVETTEETYTIKVQGGKAVLENLPTSGRDGSYFLNLSYKDTKDREVRQQLWLGMNIHPSKSEAFNPVLNRPSAKEANWEVKHSFKEGEDVQLQVQNYDKPVEEGRVLYTVTQSGISYSKISGTTFTVEYNDLNIPNINVAAAYFDGKKIYALENYPLNFNPESKELELEISPNKQSYNYGDKANVSLMVKDKKTGKAVKDAMVCLSVVDEAVFSLMNDYSDILRNVYSSVYYVPLKQSVSYLKDPMTGGGAEKGGGGDGGGIRRKFIDTATFMTGKTDSSGKAEFSFTLPDNLTSWRMTAQAITTDIRAGSKIKNIETTKDFFLQPVMPKTLIEGDDLVISLRSYGKAINESSDVQYTAKITSLWGYADSVKLSEKAGKFAHIKLKSPSKGSYTITLEAKSGNLSDAITGQLRVAESGTEVSMAKSFDLGKGIEIEPERYPVVFGFINSDYEIVADILEHINSSYGGRTDQRIARRFASELFASLSGEQQPTQTTDDLTDVLSSYGDAKLFAYAESDPELSAKVAAAAPEMLYGASPWGYFRELISNDRSSDEVTCGYLGLAANKQPVLEEIRQLLKQPDELSQIQQLRLVAALAVIGDHEGAAQLYDKLIVPNLVYETDPAGRGICYMSVSENIDENLMHTAYASITASIIGRPEAEKIIRHLLGSDPKQNLYLLEEIIYLKSAKPNQGKDAVLSYNTEEGRETLKLGKLGMKFVTMSEPQLKKAYFKAEEGNITARAFYVGTANDAMDRQGRNLTVTKKIETKDSILVNDTVRVTIDVEVPLGVKSAGIVIDDYIPTGMRFTGLINDSQTSYYYYADQQGQRVRFTIGNINPVTQDVKRKYTLTYFARCVSPGRYVVDSAFAATDDGTVWGLSEKSEVEIAQ